MARARKRLPSTSSSDNEGTGFQNPAKSPSEASYVSQSATNLPKVIGMDSSQQSKYSASLHSRLPADSSLETTAQHFESEPHVTNDENNRGQKLNQATSFSRKASMQAAEHIIEHEDHEHGSEQLHGTSHIDHSLGKEVATATGLQKIRQWTRDPGTGGVFSEVKELKPDPRSRIAAAWVNDAALAGKNNNRKVLITKHSTTNRTNRYFHRPDRNKAI